jgi:hypothetical protein
MKKQRYWLYRRGGIYYIHDSQTGVRESLQTRNKQEAEQIRTTRNMTSARPVIGMSLAKAYLTSQDPKLLARTWQNVVDEFCSRGNAETQAHRRKTSLRQPQNLLLKMKLIETTSDDLLKILKEGGVMTNGFVRCLYNLAMGFGWLPWPILPPKLWPTVETKPKRAITRDEHERILAAEKNPDRRLYYELLWETGAAQTDGALLRAEYIDWQRRILSYQRKKTGEWAHLQIGKNLKNCSALCHRKACCCRRSPRATLRRARLNFAAVSGCWKSKACRFIPTATLGRSGRGLAVIRSVGRKMRWDTIRKQCIKPTRAAAWLFAHRLKNTSKRLCR